MSDQEVILRALARVRGRLRLRCAVQDLAAVLGMIAVALLLWRALRVAGDAARGVFDIGERWRCGGRLNI